MTPPHLDVSSFKAVVRNTPLVSIDLIITDSEGKVLVGERANDPAKGFWFVPGGRIRKGETLASAFHRLLLGETGLSRSISDAAFLGVFEHHYETNTFNDPDFGTHYVVLGYRVPIGGRPAIRQDDQHLHMQWMSEAAILDAPAVHENTKAYFRL